MPDSDTAGAKGQSPITPRRNPLPDTRQEIGPPSADPLNLGPRPQSRPLVSPREFWGKILISIPVLVDQSLLPEHQHPSRRARTPASILVLVDRSLRRQRSRLAAVREAGFNPCFGGSVSTTAGDMVPECLACVVSILVLVDRSLRRRLGRGPDLHGRVSILVLVDRSLRLDYDAAAAVMPEMFQSLFWWIGLYDHRCQYSGLRASAKFQSLFWWIGLYDWPCPAQSTGCR